ncbi:PREDICTED: Retrovirus-related Pol poly from transposon, partial [Prunus dulcis]
PEGFELKNASHKVYKLRKALYGLKQAPRAWYSEIDAYLSIKRMQTEFKREMMQRYEMSDLGLLHHFLGMGILQTDQGVFIHQ